MNKEKEYLINTESINKIIKKKFKISFNDSDTLDNNSNSNYTKITKNNNNILLYLFLKKIYYYEPGLVKLIGFLHDCNYKYLKMYPYLNVNLNQRPKKLSRCMGNYYINNDDVDSCICSSCDPDGFNLLKPYRICHRL